MIREVADYERKIAGPPRLEAMNTAIMLLTRPTSLPWRLQHRYRKGDL